MVVEVFMYMFFVGSGLALGFASIGLLSWKVYKKMQNKTLKKRKGAVI